MMRNHEWLRLCVPFIDDDEANEIQQVLNSGYLTQGPKVAQFEKVTAAYVGTKHAFATTSATTALHLSLAALGIGPGDEVLVPDFTFPATANVVIHQGATPILVDIDLDTFTLNLKDLADKITPRSRAIIPVHLFGISADMKPINSLAATYELAVLEDAACALGSTYYDKRCGNLGTLGCFSFHPRKVITTGEGGMITTNNDSLAQKIEMLRSHGGIRNNNRYNFEAAGFNYRLSDIQGALGMAQMRKLDTLISTKRSLATQLTERLKNISGITTPHEPAWRGHIYQTYIVLLDEDINRDRIIQLMKERGIETTIGTYALHAQPIFHSLYGYHPGAIPQSYQAYRRTLSLPLHFHLSQSDLDRIAQELERAIDQSRE